MAHCGLIGDASAFAATEKPDVVIGNASIEDARRVMAFAAQEHEISPAIIGIPPIAADGLPYRVQWFAAGGFARKFQNQLVCIRSTVHFKPDRPE